MPATLARAYARAPWPYLTKRVLRKLGVARVNWLRPSYSSLDEMCALARRLVDHGVPVLNMLFHSSEAIVGGSPYNRTQGELDSFLRSAHALPRVRDEGSGAVPQTFREFHAEYVRPAAAASAAPSDAVEHPG